MRLESLTRPELIFHRLVAGDGDAVLRTFAAGIAELGLVRSADELQARLREREQLGSTGIGGGVAIPHCKLKGLERPLLAIGLTDEPGVDFGAVDGKPVRLFFLLVSPLDAPAEHLQVLAAISRWIKADQHVADVLASRDAEEVYTLLQQAPK
jgi:nitrogen PTS system EIIA component